MRKWSELPVPARFLLLVAILIAAWFAYRLLIVAPSSAYGVYEAYADALASGRYDEAAALSIGQAKAHVETVRLRFNPAAAPVPGIPGMASPAGAARDEIAWIKRDVKTEKSDGQSATALTVMQAVCRAPRGVAPAACKQPEIFVQDVKVRPENGRLVVSSFNESRPLALK